MKSEVKKDKGKLRYDLIPYASLDEVVKVLTLGNLKYPKPEQNWLVNSTLDDVKRYEAAIMRHMSAVFQGEEFDLEMKTDHLAHVACNCLFIMAIKEKYKADRQSPSLTKTDVTLLAEKGWMTPADEKDWQDRTTQCEG